MRGFTTQTEWEGSLTEGEINQGIPLFNLSVLEKLKGEGSFLWETQQEKEEKKGRDGESLGAPWEFLVPVGLGVLILVCSPCEVARQSPSLGQLVSWTGLQD